MTDKSNQPSLAERAKDAAGSVMQSVSDTMTYVWTHEMEDIENGSQNEQGRNKREKGDEKAGAKRY